MDIYEHRRRMLGLTDDQQTVQDAFADFFQKAVPATRVKAAEPLGFDGDLWAECVELGLTAMALPEDFDGDGAGMLDLALIAEEVGRSLAPVPLFDHIVASRLLAASGDPAFRDLVDEAAAGERILAFSARPLTERRLVAHAAIARDVVGFDGETLVVVRAATDREHVRNRACLPSAWVDPAVDEVLPVASPDAAALFRRAVDESDVLMAAALAGLTAGALAIGAEFTKTRETQGIVIAKLQGVAFQLADVHVGIESSRQLARRAAWYLDNEPDAEPHLPAAALVYAAETSVDGVTHAAHVQGGLGFTVEAGTTPYWLRGKGWALSGADLGDERRHVGVTKLAAHG